MREWREIGAFHLYRSHNIQLLNNEVTSSRNGILLLFSPSNQIKGNRIVGALYGVALFKSGDNAIDSNTFSTNDHNAVLVDSKNNTVRYNNFSHKQRQAYETGANLWQANYWDDYSGVDSDGNGFGNSPYTISGAVADNTPQMSPYPGNPVPVPQLVPAEFKETPWQGEWIRENTNWENCNKELKGWLIIENGATLTITNCVVSASPLTSGVGNEIHVRPGAGLAIYNSTLSGDGLNAYFSIRMERGASLVIRDSKIYHAGDWGGNSGIQLFGDGAVIENNEIIGNYNGIDIRGSSRHRIVGNKISDCVEGIVYVGEGVSKETVIENNVISDCFYPAFLEVLGDKR